MTYLQIIIGVSPALSTEQAHFERETQLTALFSVKLLTLIFFCCRLKVKERLRFNEIHFQ